MPYSDSKSLKLFLSYASEDQAIAGAVAECLLNSFDSSIEIQMMSKFQVGANWRQLIDDDLDRADILVAIASGRLKAGHSFTGYEIGAFAFSCRRTPKMVTFPNLPRKTVPFVVLSGVPDTIAEFQGIGIDPASVIDIKYDGDQIDNRLAALNKNVANGYDKNIFKLLTDIDDLVREANGTPSRGEEIERRRNKLKAQSGTLLKAILESLLTREKSSARPKSKLIVRVEPHSNTGIAGAELRVEGPCSNAFGVDTSSTQAMTWNDFIGHVDGADISKAWQTTLDELMSSALEGSFLDHKLTSYDRKKTFRVFISKIVDFYSNAHEFHMYVVELMRPRDYGDPETTLLLSALRVGLTYRFMFLERQSEFGPVLMEATQPSDLPRVITNLTSELEYILQFAHESGLQDPKNIIKLLGEAASPGMKEKYKLWNSQRDQLLKSAQRVLVEKGDLGRTSADFIKTLKLFCAKTKPLNDEYVSAVLRALHLMVGWQETPVSQSAPARRKAYAEPRKPNRPDGTPRPGNGQGNAQTPSQERAA
jgi:hypothetical protein